MLSLHYKSTTSYTSTSHSHLSMSCTQSDSSDSSEDELDTDEHGAITVKSDNFDPVLDSIEFDDDPDQFDPPSKQVTHTLHYICASPCTDSYVHDLSVRTLQLPNHSRAV